MNRRYVSELEEIEDELARINEEDRLEMYTMEPEMLDSTA